MAVRLAESTPARSTRARPAAMLGRAMHTLTSSDPGRGPLFTCLPSQDVLDHVSRAIDPDSLLSRTELARAQAQSGPGRRRDFVAARVLARLMLQRWRSPHAGLAAMADIVLEQTCNACGGPHGRPADVYGLAVSWARSGGFVAAAVGEGPVGVDVEALGSVRADAPIDRRAETARLRGWVRGESIIKWGHGTLDDALRWRPLLEGPVAPRGRRYVLDHDGRPHRRRRPGPRAPGVVITDAPAAVAGAMCCVAASHAARWVNPLL